jgi:hypothetical protein
MPQVRDLKSYITIITNPSLPLASRQGKLQIFINPVMKQLTFDIKAIPKLLDALEGDTEEGSGCLPVLFAVLYSLGEQNDPLWGCTNAHSMDCNCGFGTAHNMEQLTLASPAMCWGWGPLHT